MRRRVIVVGGGAAGLMAAGQAAQRGAEALLLEKMDRPGRKLCITGGGRCNLTNTAPLPEFIKCIRPDGRFLYQAFSRFFNSHLIGFFEQLGIPTVVEEEGKVFPVSGRAQDLLNALVRWVENQGVTLLTQTQVKRLIVEEGQITGVQVSSSFTEKATTGEHPSGQIHHADAVIIACGGASYPSTGSTGDGYLLAESAGHTIVPIRPALVPLVTAGNVAQRLQGVSLSNVVVRLWVDDKKQTETSGEMLFTHYGLSGPVILSLSRQVVDSLNLSRKVVFSLDLKPALDESGLEAYLLQHFDKHGKQKFATLLRELLPKSMIPVCADLTAISLDKVGHQITASERKRLQKWLKDFRLEVTGHRPFTEAMITAGGVATREVDPRTMVSRLVKGLYFAGEVLDLDAESGGYNLQTAFSTGWVAGRSAAE